MTKKMNMEYLIGLPSGQIIDIDYKEINNLKQDGLISMNLDLHSYVFKDDDYLKILKLLKRQKYVDVNINDIMEFFDKQKQIRSYKITPDGIDITGSVFIASFPGKNIPFGFKKVSGDFIFRNSKIESLKGCPFEVGGNFIVTGNNLFDLVGGPRYVGELYDCSSNLITSLEGAPEKIYTDFDCHDNFLQDLKFSPKNIKGTMDCTGNPLKSTVGAPYSCGNLITDFKKISRFSDFGKKMISDGEGKWRW